MRNTSRSRQLACSWTSMQSLANRRSRVGSSGSPSARQISAARSGWALPLKIAICRTLLKASVPGRAVPCPARSRAWAQALRELASGPAQPVLGTGQGRPGTTRQGGQRDDGRDHGRRRAAECAGDQRHRHTGSCGRRDHRPGRLSGERAEVVPALAGDDQVRLGHRTAQAAAGTSSGAPRLSRAPQAAVRPYPVPPAAPAPGAPGSPPSTAASRARPASSRATCRGSAPFCGPNTAAAPAGTPRAAGR